MRMNLQNVWQTLRRHGAPVGGLAALLILGCLVLLAAPGGSPVANTGVNALQAASPTNTAASGHQTVKRNAAQTGGTPAPTQPPLTATDTPGSTPVPTATAPVPTATDTPTPQPPTPTPTETPMPAPSWHALVTYSGNTSQIPAGTFDTAGNPWRLAYTCDSPHTNTAILVDWDGGAGYANCGPYQSSGIVQGTSWPAAAGTYTLDVRQDGVMPLPPWSVTVEVWY